MSGTADVDTANESATVNLSATSTDSEYQGKAASVTVTVNDSDTAGVVVDPVSLTISEDGTGSFTVKLATQPTASVTVTVSSGDVGAVSVPSTVLTFSTVNWGTAQSVTVSGVADADAADESVTVTATAASVGDAEYAGETASVTVTVNDSDTAGVVVDPVSLTISEDGTGSFTVKLATQPTASVTVTVSSGDAGAVSVPSTVLTFSTVNWGTAQSVTVSGVADADAADESVTVTATAASVGDAEYAGETASVTVTVNDSDTAGVVVDPVSLTISEDGTGSFTVKLATQPTASVTVTVSSGDAGAVSVPSTVLTFSTMNWGTAQSVTVSGVADADAADESVTVTATAASVGDADYQGETATATVTVNDSDTAGLVVSPETLTVVEEATGSFTVQLATQPTATVTVTVAVASTDAGEATVDMASLTFTTNTWDTAQTVTVSGTADSDTADESATVNLSATSTDSEYAGETASVAVSVTDSDCSAGASTTCSVAVGGSVSGKVDLAGDVDWFAVELVGLTVGNTYLFEVAGDGGSGGLADPVVRLFDENGDALVPDVVDSDADGDGTAGVGFTPAADGSYFVAVSEDGDDGTGTYTVAVSEVFNGIEQISVGANHVCAVLVDASVSCWGGNSAGEGSPPGGVRFVQVAASLSHACGLAGEGSITCWGDESNGRATPPAGTDFVAVVGGQEHSCGLRSSGVAVCWGSNTKGQGDVPPGVVFSSLAASLNTTCGVQADHAAVCWGGSNAGESSPPSGVSFSVVSLGLSHGCGIKTDQSVVCWGDERAGKTAPPSGPFSEIAASRESNCGLTSGGTIQCWGRNEYNVLRAPLGQFATVDGSASNSYVCALTSAGTAACWGSGAAGTVPAGLAAVVSFGADPNTPPFFWSTTLGSVEVAEGAPLSQSVAVVEDDPSDDVESVVVVSSAADAASEDHDLFAVYQDASNNHRLRFTGGFVADFEDPQDSDTGNDYVVVLRATSGTGAREMSTDVTVTVTVTDVECAGDDTTTCELAVGATDREGIETAGDTDWFEVELTADTAYQINVAGGSGSGELADPVVKLFDADGSAVSVDGSAVQDSDADNDGTAGVTFTPGTDATFYVEASEDGDDATGTYTVSVTETANQAPAFTSAGEASVEENGSLSHTVVAVDDDAGDSVTYAIAPAADHPGNDQGSFEIGQSTGALSFKSSVVLDYEGGTTTYTVVVIATGGTGARALTAEQTITVTVTNVEELPSKPDTPTLAATGLDFVRIEWTAPTFDGPAIDGYGVQYREDGAAAWIDWPHTDTATTAEITGLDAATDYEFQVQATNSDGDGPWSDALDVTTEVADDCTADTATSCSVTVGGSASGEIERDPDVDWFSMVLDPGVAYTIYVDVDDGGTGEGELADPRITGVYDSSGTLVADSSDTDSGAAKDSLLTFEHSEAAAATYYVAVARQSGDKGTYRVWVARRHPSTSVSELSGQDLPAHAGTPGHVLLGDTVSGDRSEGDVDYFGVSMKAGMSYRIDVRGECAADPDEDGGTLGDPAVELWRSDGTRTFTDLATDLNPDEGFDDTPFLDYDSGACENARMDIEALADGLHYIAATADFAIRTGTYTVTVTDITEYDVVEVAAGGSHSCARVETGVVECWGLGTNGRTAPPSGESFTQVEAGPTASCGVTDAGEIECWGVNDSGSAFSPSSGTDFVWAGIGASHGCGLASDGEVKCWGSNAGGRATPPSGATFTAISVGNEYNCGVKTDESLACWGTNQDSRTDPPSTGQFTAVASGGSHACAIKSDGTVQCWGDSTDGRDDAGSATFTSIDSHGDFSCGVKTDKSLHCWGSDSDDGRVSDVPGAGTYLMVGVGTHHACALAEDHSVRCWGANGDDELLPPVTLPGFNALPRFTSGDQVSVDEGEAFSHIVVAVDDDADDAADVSYELAGGDDAALFEIDPSTGELTRSDGATFDYESPDDSDTDNSYVLVVRATSGSGNRERATTQHITVAVQDKNEPPATERPRLLDSEADTADYVQIRWVMPFGYSTALTSVSVRYRKAIEMNYTELLDVADSTDLGNFLGEVEIFGLEPDTEYVFSAQAFNRRGPGPWSDELTVTTPPAVDDCRADTMTSCSVTVGGSADGTFGLNREIDWFAVDLESDVAYVLYLIAAGTVDSRVGIPAIVGIFDSSGQLVEGNTNVEQESFTQAKYLRFVPESTGKYFVAMNALLINDSGQYRLWVAQQLPGASVSESTTDFPSHAGTPGHVVVGDSATGELGTSSDSDRFGVQFAQDATYRIEVKGECTSDDGGDLPDPAVSLWTAIRGRPTVQDFERVGEVGSSDFSDGNSGACNNALLEVRALQSGVYYVAAFVSRSATDATGTYTVVVTELVDPAVVVVPESLPVTEGATATFEVSLAAEPTATVTVTLSSGDTGVATVSPSPLTFTTSDYGTAQTVTVTAVEDDDAADEDVTITAEASGGNYEDLEAVVAVTVDDDETPTVEFNIVQLSVTEGSATGSYEVTLGAPPTTDVEVRITRTGRGVSVSPWRLMFTPSDYDTAQIVTVTGNDDSDAEGHTVTLSHRAIGGEFEGASADVTVTVTDDDTALVTLDTATADLGLAVGEGDSISYTMVLATRPSADVTVTVTPGSSEVVVLPSTLLFTDYDWHVPRTVTVTAVVDDDATDETTTLAHSAVGGGYDAVTIDSVTVSVTDDDTAAVTVLPTSLTIEEGSSAGYVVVLDSEPSATVTVTVSVSGSDEVSVSPTPLTFTASNWSAAQTVTVSAATDTDTIGDTATISHTIAGGDYATVSVPDVSVSVTDGATLGVTVSPASLTIDEADNGDYTVVLDAAPTGDVTVTLSVSGSDEVTVAPTPLTFTTADWQIEQMVEVAASADTDVADEAATITHTLSGGGYDSVAAPTVLVTVTDRHELPTMESVQAGDEGFLATWSPAAAHAGGTITGYQIRYKPANGNRTTVDAGTGTSFQVTGMTGQTNVIHDVRVRVVIDGNAVTPWSEPMQVRIGEPSGPTKLTVEGSDSLLHIFWEPPANHESLTANGKRIRYFVRVLASGDPNSSGGWYTWDTHLTRGFTSQGALVENGTQYTVDILAQLYAANSDTVLVDGGSASATGTPVHIDVPEGDFRHAVLRDTIEHIVATQEATQGADLAGWLRPAWDWVSAQSARAEQFSNPDWRNFNTNVQDAPDIFGLTVSYCPLSGDLADSQMLRECYSTSIAIDLVHLCGDSISASQYYACMDTATATDLDPEALAANVGLVDTVIHELMHVYTTTIREMTVNVGASALPIGVADLHSLATGRSSWTLSEDLCPHELLAVVASMILLGEFSGIYAAQCLGYTANAPLKCDDALVSERCDVLREMMKGNVAPWYTDTYEGDAEKVWADVIELTTFDGVRDVAVGAIPKLGLLWGLAEEFGGYCSPLVVNNAMFDSDTTIFNPWVDGGCEPDAPPSVTVTEGAVANTFEVSWTAPDSEGGATLSGYEVEWKRGNQSYNSTRRMSVADSVLNATINVGAGTNDTYFGVRAVNEIGESTGGEVTCTYSGGTWTCTFEASAARGARGAGETRRWPVSKDLPKQIVIRSG